MRPWDPGTRRGFADGLGHLDGKGHPGGQPSLNMERADFGRVLIEGGSLMTITFVSRSEPKKNEVTIRIHQDADSILGEVSCPGGFAGSGTAAELDHDGALGVHQAM